MNATPQWKWTEHKLRHHCHLSLLDARGHELLRVADRDMQDVTASMDLIAEIPEMLRLLRESSRLFSNFPAGQYPDEDEVRSCIDGFLEQSGPAEFSDESVLCRFCDNPIHVDDAHRHAGGWVGECCWDERLRSSE